MIDIEKYFKKKRLASCDSAGGGYGRSSYACLYEPRINAKNS